MENVVHNSIRETKLVQTRGFCHSCLPDSPRVMDGYQISQLEHIHLDAGIFLSSLKALVRIVLVMP